MRKTILILLLVANYQNGIAQTNSKQPKHSKLKGDLNCVYKPKYSAKQRNGFYPFNIADTIKFVSFRYHRHNYPIMRDTILTDSLVEIKTLEKFETDELTDILYNNFYKSKTNYGTITQCYFPRNAILFLDNSGHLLEFILICFHCDRYELSSDEVIFGSDCTQKIEKLRQLFVSTGLKFGTDKTVDIYEGEGTENIIAPPIKN